MQIDIDGLHEKALLRLMERNNEKTGAGMARILIRDAAKELGEWPNNVETVSHFEPPVESQVTNGLP